MTTTPLRLLGPVIGLNVWTFAMEVWMYATRIPAINKYYGGVVSPTTPKERVWEKMPPSVRWKSDNYNHLFEQPTQFYAVVLALAVLAQQQQQRGSAAVQIGDLDVRLAWAYVGVRVVHSLVHSIGNRIMVRFGLFMVCSGLLAALTARAGLALWA